MCAVSFIADHYQQKWPILPFTQPPIITPNITITPEQFAEYLALKAKAAEYDKRTGQPDCEKPDIAAWEQLVREAIARSGQFAPEKS